jgi:Flp pilus assembly protein TadD
MRKNRMNCEQIREQLELEPFNGELYQALGIALLERGDFEAAQDAYEQAIVLDPADPWSYLYLGNLFYAQEAYGDALEQFRKAQRLDPNMAIAYVCMADAYHGLGEMALADAHYQRAVEVESDDQCAQENLIRWRKIKNGQNGPSRS